MVKTVERIEALEVSRSAREYSEIFERILEDIYGALAIPAGMLDYSLREADKPVE